MNDCTGIIMLDVGLLHSSVSCTVKSRLVWYGIIE